MYLNHIIWKQKRPQRFPHPILLMVQELNFKVSLGNTNQGLYIRTSCFSTEEWDEQHFEIHTKSHIHKTSTMNTTSPIQLFSALHFIAEVSLI